VLKARKYRQITLGVIAVDRIPLGVYILGYPVPMCVLRVAMWSSVKSKRSSSSEDAEDESHIAVSAVRLEQLVAPAQSKDWQKHLLPQPPPWVSCAWSPRTTRGLAAA
jgi:hypothetical protein